MAIFKLAALDGSVSLIVRARCLTCARDIGASRAGNEGSRMWRDPDRSSVELVRNPEHHGYLSDGKSGLIKRIQHAAA